MKRLMDQAKKAIKRKNYLTQFRHVWGLRWLLAVVAHTNNWLVSASLILTLSFIGAGVSGCQGPWVHAKVFVDDGGELYIDIPEAKKHKYAVLYGLDISKVGSNDIFWSFNKSGYSSNAEVAALPLRYGETVKGSITEFPAKKLENGTYTILGFIKFFDSDDLEKVGTPFDAAHITGSFVYKNGVVQNISN